MAIPHMRCQLLYMVEWTWNFFERHGEFLVAIFATVSYQILFYSIGFLFLLTAAVIYCQNWKKWMEVNVNVSSFDPEKI